MQPVPVSHEHTSATELIIEFNKLDTTSKWYTDILIQYANKPDVRHVAECGVFQGMSTAAFLSCDIDKLDSYDIDLSLVYRPMFNRVKGDIEWNLERKNSLKDSVGEVDLLFLDTMHTYDHVKKEIFFQGPNARKYIIVHDANYPPPRKNPTIWVRDAVNEFVAENNDLWKIVVDSTEGTGIMVLEKISA